MYLEPVSELAQKIVFGLLVFQKADRSCYFEQFDF